MTTTLKMQLILLLLVALVFTGAFQSFQKDIQQFEKIFKTEVK